MINLPQQTGIRRILILKWSAMGDVVIASALFEDIRKAFPRAEIDLNIMPPWDTLFRRDDRFQRLLVLDLKGKMKGWRGIGEWLRQVRRSRYDLIIDLQSNDRSRLLLFLLHLTGGAPRWRMGNHRRFPYNIAPEAPSGPLHAFRHQQATLRAGGIPAETPRPVLRIARENEDRARELRSRHGLTENGYAALLPGSNKAGRLKRWGAERYAALAQKLHQSGLEKIALIGGPDELDECRRIEQICSAPWLVNLCGRTQLLDLIPLFAASRLIVGNDTGTAHLASCTDRPLLVICGPTDPRRVKPAGDNVQTLQADLPCVNCYRKECAEHRCMDAITSEQILAAVRRAVWNS